MNKIVLIGRLTRDPEIRSSNSGKTYVDFTLAVTRRFNRDEADFISIRVFGKLSEIASKYLSKGKQCGVIGALQINSYTDNQGEQKYFTQVIADEIELLGGKSESNDSHDDNFPKVDDDDIPF